jgi:hypothetical protein
MLRISTTAADQVYTDPFLTKAGITHIQVDVSLLTNAEVDAQGYLKPGVPLKADGTLVANGQAVYGLTIEAEKIADGNTALAGITVDPLVAVTTIALVNRDIAEDNLGRAYNANEIAGFALAGSTCKLTTT